jgi:hypothetical protein
MPSHTHQMESQQQHQSVLTHQLNCPCGYLIRTKEQSLYKRMIRLHSLKCEIFQEYMKSMDIKKTTTINNYQSGRLLKTQQHTEDLTLN